MKAITAKSPHDSSFSYSRRYFHWKKKIEGEDDDDDEEEISTFSSSSHACEKELKVNELEPSAPTQRMPIAKASRKKLPVAAQLAVSKLRSALAVFSKRRSLHSPSSGLGTRVVGTLFGYRRGHVHLAFQQDPKLGPAFMVELATPTSVLVKEMASGLVRIALECEKKVVAEKKSSGVKLLEEPIWRTFCNGKKCGYAVRRECGPDEGKVLQAVGPVTMGAGVLPGNGNGNEAGGSEGELMYMRAKFERVVGSKDSEAFYMMNPDGHGGPELSIYLLRV